MKVRVTRNQLKRNYYDVYNIGYCDIADITSVLNCTMYTCGVYGWNSNIFDCYNGYAISTGYRPCGNKSIDYSIAKKYNDRFNRLKHKTSDKAIQYLQAIIKEQKERDKKEAKK